MNNIAENIKQRLSMREPLQESLDIVAKLADTLTLKKPPTDADKAETFLKDELAKVKALFPTCTNFERDFPSVAFSIATGVGKTRLMGACVAYLYLKKGIRNFFVLAPNLTIYNKLIEDFGNPAYHKYLFNGITEFVHHPPVIITGDNYNQHHGMQSVFSGVNINIFNIAKFNSDNKGQKKGGIALAPRIKRLSEYLGQSYFDYLSALPDLVILMDEAHRYHADASKNAINELRPVFGLEMTATPIDEKGKPFKNVVYEYSLARALADGKYVKNPAIATRRNFDKADYSDDDIQRIKLEDAMSIHENTKTELDIYSRSTGQKQVKPFVLVVCRDIAHATDTAAFIESADFYKGRYKGKVLRIDSSSIDEVEEKFISLESVDNNIEIVVHVNMLKEGWDVTNLYTIVPLRAANASVLIEQTIGRGLRLPYDGKRTGVESVDKLTVLAHENFQAVIDAAKDENSIINKMSHIVIEDDTDFGKPVEAFTTKSIVTQKIETERAEVAKIENPIKKQEAQNIVEAKFAIITALLSFKGMPNVRNISDLAKPEPKQELVRKAIEVARATPNLFIEDIITEIEKQVDTVIEDKKRNEIEIPQITIYRGESIAYFKPFDLDTSKGFSLKALDAEIIRLNLIDDKTEIIKSKASGIYADPVKTILLELIDYPEIDADDYGELIFTLASQAVDAIRLNLDKEEELPKTVFDYKRVIAENIYNQMMKHFVIEQGGFISDKVLPFTRIRDWNGKKLANDGIKDYRDVVTPTSSVTKYLYIGFEKAGHSQYKFDSKTELDLAYILENDTSVLKWLYPAPLQFNIVWDNGKHNYRPDFVIETADTIYMLETKRADAISNDDVQKKRLAAEKYCADATAYTIQNGGKPWKYILVPHDIVQRTSSLDYVISRSE